MLCADVGRKINRLVKFPAHRAGLPGNYYFSWIPAVSSPLTKRDFYGRVSVKTVEKN